MTTAERNSIIEACAVAAEAQDRVDREWVRDSLWDAVLRRAGANVRALKTEPVEAGPPVSLAHATVSDLPPAMSGDPWSARNTPATAEAYRLRHNARVEEHRAATHLPRPLAECPALASAVLGSPRCPRCLCRGGEPCINPRCPL